MHGSDPTNSDDDFEVEIVDLDPQGSARPKQRSVQQPFRLSSRTRSWLTGISLLSGVLLLVLVLSSILPASTPIKRAVPPATQPGATALNIVVVNGIAYVTSDDSTVYALHANNGTPLWHYKPAMPTALTVINGVVYLNAQNTQGNFVSLYVRGLIRGSPSTQIDPSDFVEALQADNGTRLWKHSMPPGISPVIIDGDTAYPLITNTPGNHIIAALNARDGSQLWQYTFLSAPANIFIHAEQDKVFVDAAFGENMNDAVLSVFKTSDGTLLWHYHYTASEVSFGIPVIDHNLIYIQGQDGSIKAVSTDTGAQVWRYKSEKYGLWGAFSQDGVVYTSVADGSIKALRADTGALLWHYNNGEIVSRSPREIGGVVYIKTNVGTIDAVQARDGQRLWRYTVPPSLPFADIEVAGVADGVTYMYARGTPDTTYSMIYALSTGDGALLWQSKTAYSNALLDMQAQNGIVYLQEDNANFVVLRASDGVMLWRASFSSHTSPLPHVYNGMVYMIAEDGTLDVRLGSTGTLLWHYL
ncbi:MAG: PQQ-binding-like beta-propeller repeat protein [Ktedonobacteraceae bacterium]|nr:PQQ-binding-like beta-propeller repeat protein [Ktedonobacteraceae bacterium]